MEMTISMGDQALRRFGNQLAALGSDRGAMAMSRALNHEGQKAMTQIKRALAKQTGMKYGDLSNFTRAVPASPSTLSFGIRVSGRETNIAAFGGRQTAAGVSAAPWGRRQLFAHAFMASAVKGAQGLSEATAEGGKMLAFMRLGRSRLPIRPIFGPNIAREALKGEAKETFEKAAPAVLDRLGYEIQRILQK
jgi:hypothetical protein